MNNGYTKARYFKRERKRGITCMERNMSEQFSDSDQT